MQSYVVPLAYTTFGAISNDTAKWMKQVEEAAIAGANYFPDLQRRFSVVQRENISFAIAKANAKAARKAYHKHLSQNH